MKYNLSEIKELIADRRTIKPEDFSDRKVHKEIIESLLNAAKWAPTHGLTQPWHFTVFIDEGIATLAHFQAETYKQLSPDFKEKTYELLKNRPFCATAIIAISMKRQEPAKIPETEEISAVSCAVQNMMLLAAAYGLGSYWGSGGVTYWEETKTFLSLDTKDKCLGFLYLGYPKTEWPKGQRKPIEYFTHWVNS